MSNIPGLSLLPVGNDDKIAVKMPSFVGDLVIRESHKHGNCRRINEFKRVSVVSKGQFFDIYLCRDLKVEEKETQHLKKGEKPHASKTDSSHDTDIEEKYKQYRHLKKFRVLPGFKDGIPREMIREFNILYALNHVNIIKSHGPVTGSSLDSNYLLLDYCRFSLKDVMKKKFAVYDESVVKCITHQLFQGLQYMHSSLVLHRNFSTENIAFNSGGILKITGYEYACFDTGDLRTPVNSDKRYKAPELLLFSDRTAYNTKVDMWSAGCVLAEFGLKKPIFEGDTDIKVLNSIFKVLGTPNDTVWPGFNELFALIYEGKRLIEDPKPYCSLNSYITGASTPCLEIINRLLQYSAKSRFSAKECLEMKYFKENPAACSTEHLTTILEASVKTPVKPTT